MGRRRNWQGDDHQVDPSWSDWQDPIVVKIAGKRPSVIDNPADALIYIFRRWPCPRASTAEAAKNVCSRVLRRKANTEEARTAFLAAVLEAEIIDYRG